MGILGRQTRAELKQVPFLLLKLAGGVMAAIGFGTAAWITTHQAGPPWVKVGLLLVLGVIGVGVFALGSRLLADRVRAGRIGDLIGGRPGARARFMNSVLSWSILLTLAAFVIQALEPGLLPVAVPWACLGLAVVAAVIRLF